MADAWRVVVTREPEWDDESRGRAVHHAGYKRGICNCGCGLPYDVSHDPEQAFLVDFTTCRAGQQIAKEQRKHADKLGESDPQWSAGRSYYAVPLSREEAEDMLAEQQARAAEAALARQAQQDIIPD